MKIIVGFGFSSAIRRLLSFKGNSPELVKEITQAATEAGVTVTTPKSGKATWDFPSKEVYSKLDDKYKERVIADMYYNTKKTVEAVGLGMPPAINKRRKELDNYKLTIQDL